MFGLAGPEQAIRASFVTVAVWWVLFAIPLLRQRFMPAGPPIGLARAAREGFAELLRTFREVRKYRPVILFLLAYWMYIDGVNTIMKMAVDYGLALGFPANSLIIAHPDDPVHRLPDDAAVRLARRPHQPARRHLRRASRCTRQ